MTTRPDWYRPPNGDTTHPPFEPGNDAAVTHGAYSPAAIAARTVEVHDALLAHAPWLDERHYLPAVNRYLEATAREQLAHAAITNWTGKAFPTRLLETATAASRLAAKLGSELGLDPTGHARLRAIAGQAEVTAATLSDLIATGRSHRIAAEATTNPPVPAVGAPQPSEAIQAPSDAPEPADGQQEGNLDR